MALRRRPRFPAAPLLTLASKDAGIPELQPRSSPGHPPLCPWTQRVPGPRLLSGLCKTCWLVAFQVWPGT